MSKPLRWSMGIALFIIVFIGAVILHHSTFTSRVAGMNDFMSRWEGARSFFVDGVSPYSDQASLNIQTRIYGRPSTPEEDPGYFVYPFYTAFLVAPTVGMDYAWASAVWMVTLEACLVIGMILLLNLYGYQPTPIVFALILLYALLEYPAGRGLFLGQPSHVVYALQIFTIWALYRKQGLWAGIALACATFKPQMTYMIAPLLLLWALRYQQWRFIGGFIGMFAVLMGASFILQPDWFGDWLNQMRLYPDYTSIAYPDTGSPVWIITQEWLKLGDIAEIVVSAVFVLTMLWGWFMLLIQKQTDRFLWVVALTLVVTHLVALRTATPHFVIFNLVWLFYISKFRPIGVMVSLLVGMVGLWGLFFFSVQGRDTLEHPIMFLPASFFAFGLLIITRKSWWEHAPRFGM
ncbi:MAG TPA: glycosyltransferase family 87 protein, partial [Aggregatilineales bacterium]|nr:glycosyltransferase family 87 protein [Aggregatilineales bacterium]